MNREIKFRGKRVDNGEWVYGAPYFIPSEGVAFIINNCRSLNLTTEDSVFDGVRVDHATVGQLHNALTRKAGKDVYVGDIISHGLAAGLGQPAVRNQTSPVNDIEFDYSYYTDVRVIGNIHEKGADQ